MYNQGSSFSSFGSAFRLQPVAIRTIIAITVVIYLIQLLIPSFTGIFGFTNEWQTALTQPWRFVTYLFLHSNFWHLLFNMLWLYWMGRQIELDIGPRNLSSIYFLSGIGGALINLFLISITGESLVIGASGAVYGVMVAFGMLYPNTPIMLFLLPPIPAKYVVTGLILLDVVLIGDKSNVARMVHIGGALIGFFMVTAYKKGYSISRWIDFIMFYVSRYRNKAENLAKKSQTKPRNPNMRAVQDVEIVEEVDQTELDSILDKIAKSGYDALTDSEKRKLFEMSKRK